MKPGWTEVALGDVAQFVNGAAFKETDWSKVGHRIIRIQNLTDSSKPFNRTEKRVKADLYVSPGDLLVSWSATLGVFVWVGPDVAVLNQHIFRVIPDQAVIDQSYLRYMLQRAVVDMARHTHGATMKHINRKEFLGTRFPLPPLEEQRRIAAILDKADELLAKRRAAIAHLDTLTQAIFLDMFGDPASNPKRFPTRPLADVAQFLDHERRPITAADREPGPVPYFGANGVQGYVAEHLFDEPLVLVAEDGGYFDQPNRGIAYFIQGRSWVNNHAHVLRVSEDIDERFLTMAIRHRDVSQFLTGSTRAKLTKTAASRIPVAIPPFDRQVKFGELDQRTQELRDQQSGKLLVMSQLIASLQARAFRGEL